METLLSMDNKLEQEKRLYDHIFEMLNYEKVIFNGKTLDYGSGCFKPICCT